MPSRHQDALVQLLSETAQRYVDHQEDELGHPVLKRDYFWGIARHFVDTLVALAADEADPPAVVEDVLRQVRTRALTSLEDLGDELSAGDDSP